MNKEPIMQLKSTFLLGVASIAMVAQATAQVDATPASAPTAASAASAAGMATAPASFASMQSARDALNEAIRAYESGDVLYFERQLDPDMIGRSRMMDALRRDANNLRQVRLHLKNVEQHAGPDVTVIRARWEKRYLSALQLQPGLSEGHSAFLLHRTREGWRLAAIAGDQPFGGGSGTLAQLTVRPNQIPVAGLPSLPAAYAPFVIELVDPDLNGIPSLSVEVRTAQGDRELVPLIASGPGRFISSPTAFQLLSTAGGLSGNGVIEVTGPTTLTVRHVDQQPGQGRPALTLTRRVAIN